MSCFGREPIEYTSETYYAPTSWDFFEEKFVAFGAETDAAALKFRNVVSWVPSEPKAIVIICHGLHEHALRYHKVAHSLTARRFVVYGMDHIGHGKSSGPRALIPDYISVVKDFASFAAYVRRIHPTLPLFILGHSMGTLITMLAIEAIPDVSALVLSGIILYPGEGSSSPFGCRCLYPVSTTGCGQSCTSCFATIDPKGPAAPIIQSALTSDPDEIDIIRKDPFFYDGDILNKTQNEMNKMSEACRECIQDIKVPFMAIHGGNDTVALLKGADYVMEHTTTSKSKKELVIMEGLKHECFHEKQPDGNESIKIIVNYFDKVYDTSRPDDNGNENASEY